MNNKLTGFTVDEVTSHWSSRTISVNMEYQRGAVWTLLQQKVLIDSVLRGYPLPRFYFHRKTGRDLLGNEANSFEIIDGQQRIRALAAYRADQWPLLDPKQDRKIALPESVRSKPAPWANSTFSQLPPELQSQFLASRLSVVVIEGKEADDEVRDLFIRLQAGTALTRQQARDAWPGNLGPYIERLAGKGQRQPIYKAFNAVDQRGQTEADDGTDPFLAQRQTCAQMLLLFLHRVRQAQPPSLLTRNIDELYHDNTGFDQSGPDAKGFERDSQAS